MIIRKAETKDIDEIIEVLKAGLGEQNSKKTKKIWQYKHLENPFGKSLVLVAEKDNKIIGVRAFMAWNWQKGDKIYKTYRAVDTATHPDYQRQGVFKKLTLKALKIADEQGNNFVFNTPNSNSKPGYLKMGWQEVNKISLSVVPVFINSIYAFTNNDNIIKTDNLDLLCQNVNKINKQKQQLFTPKSEKYLKWRYQDNPIIKYHIVKSDDFFLAYYIKKHRYFIELRVSELLINNNIDCIKIIKKLLIKKALKNKALIITLSNKNIFNLRFFGNYGPVLTYRNLNQSTDFNNFALCINNWRYSIGDLELF